MNNVILTGRPTKEVDVRMGQMKTARFTLAVSRGKEKADFINCIAFDKVAEFAERYVRKGKRVLVRGRIQTGSYERDGERVYTTDVIAETIEPIDWEEPINYQPTPQETARQMASFSQPSASKMASIPNQYSNRTGNDYNFENSSLDISMDDLPF